MKDVELCRATIQQILRKASDQYSGRNAVEYNGDYYTWDEIDALSGILASDFAYRGFREGDHVGIWSPNNLMWVLTFFAAIKIGAVAVLINSNYTASELEKAVQIGGVKWLCFGSCPRLDDDPGMLGSIRESHSGLLRDMIDIRQGSTDLIRRLSSSAKHDGTVHDNRNAACDDVCCMIFTSGTTKSPKCAMLTHNILVNNSANMAELMRITEKDSLCMSMPLFHIFGLCGSFLACVHCGALIHLMDKFKSIDIMNCVDEHKCTILNGVPTSYLALINNSHFPEYKLKSIRVGVLGGASVTVNQIRRIQDMFPRTVFMSNYGQTEGACLTNSMFEDTFEHLSTTAGLPMNQIRLEIRNTETNKKAAVGEVGEIVVKGYNVMKGYYNPDSGVEPIDKGGWLHTEDLGIMDKDGYVRVIGRIKDIIIRGGENITPSEVEEAILAYDQVSEAKVVGAPHEILGEQVIACLILKQSNLYKEEELRAILRCKLASFKQPAHIFLYDGFPLGGSGKISTSKLRDDISERLSPVKSLT